VSAAGPTDFVSGLREQLVDAAGRERARRLPRPAPIPARTIVGAIAGVALIGLVAFAATGGLRSDPQVTKLPRVSGVQGRSLFGGSLEADVRYRTRVFVPALSFEVGDSDWFMSGEPELDRIVLERRRRNVAQPGSERPPREFLTFQRLSEVYDPYVGDLLASRIPAPRDYHAWLRKHPDVSAGPVEPVTIAGVPGQAFDASIHFKRPAHLDPDCRERFLASCTAIAPGDAYYDGTRMHTIVLPLEDAPLVINQIGRSADDLERLEVAAVPVLKSLRIGVR
jgi:hypothetical protein